MEICSEHGSDIAYTKDGIWGGCPACEEIETINKDHNTELEQLKQEIEEQDSRIDFLEGEVGGY